MPCSALNAASFIRMSVFRCHTMRIKNYIDDSELYFLTPMSHKTLKSWLHSYEPSKATHVTYKAVVNRLLSFLVESQISLENLSDDDGRALLDWVEKKYDLKASSLKHFYTVANQIFGVLKEAGHITKNPLKLHKNTLKYKSSEPRPFENSNEEITTFLDLDTWNWLWDWLCTRSAIKDSDVNKNARDRFFMALLYHTGIRREEVTKLKMSHVVYRNNKWRLLVSGKGGKTRTVSMNSVLISELFRYRTHYGLDPQPSSTEDNLPLLLRLKGDVKKPLSVRGVSFIVEEIRNSILAEENYFPGEHIINQLDAMTTHWLRHTNATHRLLAGASLETTQDELGHVSPTTTRIYTHTMDNQRDEDAEKLAQLPSKK